jgi:membrane fusion protein, heavy metal efflux system
VRAPLLRTATVAFLLVTVPLLAACRGAAAPEPSGEPHAGHDDDATLVHLTPESITAAGIVTAVVSRQEFHPHVVATGVIRPPADRSVSVRAPLAGRVARVLVDVGDRVRAGQPLAALDSADLSAAVSRLRAAEARLGATESGLARGRRLLELGAMSRAEVEARLAKVVS